LYEGITAAPKYRNHKAKRVALKVEAKEGHETGELNEDCSTDQHPELAEPFSEYVKEETKNSLTHTQRDEDVTR
jgi:hypothetical protein